MAGLRARAHGRVASSEAGGFGYRDVITQREGAMHGRDKGVLVGHDPGLEVGGAEIARRLRIGRRSVDNWIADGTLDTGDCVCRYGPRSARPSQFDPFRGIITARSRDKPQMGEVRLLDEIEAAGHPADRTNSSFSCGWRGHARQRSRW